MQHLKQLFPVLIATIILAVVPAGAILAQDEDVDVYSIVANPTEISSGQEVEITFTTPDTSNNSRDWIGLYRAGDPSDQWLTWQRTDESTSGSVTFAITEAPGDYEFRYGKNFERVFVATSNVVTVTGGPGDGDPFINTLTPALKLKPVSE